MRSLVAVAAGEMVVRKRAEPQSHFRRFWIRCGRGCWPGALKTRRRSACNKSGAPRPRQQSRLADARLKAGSHFLLGFANGRFELRGEIEPVLDEIVEPV